jgi:hypothetical protein
MYKIVIGLHEEDYKFVSSFSRAHEVKRPCGRHWHKWDDNIRTYLTGCEVVDWIHLTCGGAQWWTVVNMILKFKVSWNCRECLAHLSGGSHFKDCAIWS